ncbi:hypothetical protein NQ318_015357, partial [Aromia moschata]
DGRILGPYFFDVNLTGASYLDFLRDGLIPDLITLYPDIEERDRPRNDIFFQQDGASPDYAAPVRAYLDEVFPNRWIGRRGPIEWPLPFKEIVDDVISRTTMTSHIWVK